MTCRVTELGRALGPCLVIGRKPCGRWAVEDESHLCGGLFTNQTDAIRFATAESQRRLQSILLLPDGVDSASALDLKARATLTAAERRP